MVGAYVECDMRLFLLAIVAFCVVGCGEQSALPLRKAAAPERKAWDNERHPLYGDVESLTTVLHHYDVDYMGERVSLVDTIQQAFNVTPRENTAFLPRVMSRKKQVIPMLSALWG